MKDKLILIGGGGHCRSCIDVIEQTGLYNIVGIVDRQEKLGHHVLGYQIIGTDDELDQLTGLADNFFITVGQIGNSQTRIQLFNRLIKLKCKLPVIISPNSYVSKHAEIGAGTIIMHHAVVNAGSRIGRNCIINTKALVEHDAVIGDHCHISTAAVINGGVVVGEKTFFGSGAVSKQSIDIKSNSFIKANSIVK